MFGSLIDSLTNTVDEFIDDPVGKTVNVVTQPLYDVVDVVDGLTEGELRTKAAFRLGVEYAAGMSVAQLVDWYNS